MLDMLQQKDLQNKNIKSICQPQIDLICGWEIFVKILNLINLAHMRHSCTLVYILLGDQYYGAALAKYNLSDLSKISKNAKL